MPVDCLRTAEADHMRGICESRLGLERLELVQRRRGVLLIACQTRFALQVVALNFHDPLQGSVYASVGVLRQKKVTNFTKTFKIFLPVNYLLHRDDLR
jgi:hypothetical protein